MPAGCFVGVGTGWLLWAPGVLAQVRMESGSPSGALACGGMAAGAGAGRLLMRWAGPAVLVKALGLASTAIGQRRLLLLRLTARRGSSAVAFLGQSPGCSSFVR